MIRILRTLLVIVVIAVIGMAAYMRMVDDDPADWHTDPAAAERTGSPNDYLVAPEGATAAKPDRTSKVYAGEPRDLLSDLDEFVRGEGAKVIDGSVDDLWITYVQRTTVMGFPDYISVKAVPINGGSALIIWSRSRFGHSDLGANKARIDSWLEQLGG